MQTHVISAQLHITARDHISRADILNDLNKQLSLIQEQAPYRHSDGGGWWTNSQGCRHRRLRGRGRAA